jgi:hypothetical protein
MKIYERVGVHSQRDDGIGLGEAKRRERLEALRGVCEMSKFAGRCTTGSDASIEKKKIFSAEEKIQF